MALLGLLLAMVGQHAISGAPRFRLDIGSLDLGFSALVAIPAIFIIGDALLYSLRRDSWHTSYRWLPTSLFSKLAHRENNLLRILAIAATVGILLLIWFFAQTVYEHLYANRDNWLDMIIALGAPTGDASDLIFAVGFGIFGSACLLLGWNRAGLCLGLLLGELLEAMLTSALQLKNNADLWSVFDNPVSLLYVRLAYALFFWSIIIWIWQAIKTSKAKQSR